jgi:hypothetical protein
MICAIDPFSLAHQWRNTPCADDDWRYSKNVNVIRRDVANFPLARHRRNVGAIAYVFQPSACA